MCQVTLYKNAHCKCLWGEISMPCARGMGFTTCGQVGNGIARLAPDVHEGEYFLCPEHTMQGLYDRNRVRMVVGSRRGFKWGTGPSAQDAGVEIPCVVM